MCEEHRFGIRASTGPGTGPRTGPGRPRKILAGLRVLAGPGLSKVLSEAVLTESHFSGDLFDCAAKFAAELESQPVHGKILAGLHVLYAILFLLVLRKYLPFSLMVNTV